MMINIKGKLFSLAEPQIMAILNATPDSFFNSSRTTSIQAAVDKAGSMLAAGAAILDIGGQSTRPGSERVEMSEELERVAPVIQALREAFPDAILSIDTFYGKVAETAVELGIDIINDVSAGQIDPTIITVAATAQVPYILMHAKGTPQNMQHYAHYENLIAELLTWFSLQIQGLREKGIKDIIVDPGIGFAKTAEHNFSILKNLATFKALGTPILLGVSRKGLIWKTLGITPETALNGTTVLHTIGLQNGANVLRVHDVTEAREAIQLVKAIKDAS